VSKQNAEQKPWREREFLTPQDVAGILLVSEATARELVHTLPHVRVGKLLRVRTVYLEQFIKKQERGPRGD